MTKYLDLTGLQYYKQKQDAENQDTFVEKELKSGSETAYKVLSDNNLTDALLTKLNNAGTSSFNGNYDSLTNRPSIASITLTGNKTLADLGIAAASDIPVNVSELNNDSNFQTGTQVSSAINAAVASAYIFRGSKATVEELPTQGNIIGDVWNVEEDGMNYAWTGTEWDGLGGVVDLSGYALVDHIHDNATTTTAGFMSAADKTKLEGVSVGAEVNQNAFSNITVGSTTIAADAKTDTLTLTAGSNVALTPNATNDSITIAATDTTYSEATTSTAGLLSASDKAKLNGVATGAEVNQNAFTSIVIGATTIAADSKTDAFTIAAGTNVTLTPDTTTDKVTIAAKDTTYTAATQSAEGLMSVNDKVKLDGIASITNTEIDTLFA